MTGKNLVRVRRIIERTLDELPSPIRDALENSNITIDILDRPPLDLGPDVFGTFSGGTVFEQESAFEVPIAEPARVELYLSTFAELLDDAETWEEEIRLTVIHEIGHFLGFGEEDLEDV